MVKKYVVRLSDAERLELEGVVGKLKGTSQKVMRARILLKADADGPGWSDEKIAEAFSCRTRTIEKLRQRLVERGFEETLNGRKNSSAAAKRLLNGEQEAQLIATRFGAPPKGFANWSLRLLARQVVALEIAPAISYETVRRVLKKRDDAAQDRVLGPEKLLCPPRLTPSSWRTWNSCWRPMKHLTIRGFLYFAWKQVRPPTNGRMQAGCGSL